MRKLKQVLMAGFAAAMVSSSVGQALADEVDFMSWTVAEETGKEIVGKMAAGFEENTGNKVEFQGYAWGEMNKNYILRARSNTLPDVGQSQGRLLPVIGNIDQLQDFNEVIGREELLNIFDEGFLSMGEVNGKQVALPWITGTIGMVANLEVLEKAGISEVPTTVEEFKAALEQVRDKVPNSVPLGLATKNNNSILLDYMTWVWIFGGDPLTADGKPAVNSPEAVAALEFMADAVKNRLAAPEIDRPDARRLFAHGATAFYIDAPQALSFARKLSGRGEEIDAVVKPVKAPVLKEGDTPVSMQWGHVLVLFGDENGKPDSAAVEWIKYLLSTDVLVPYATDQSVLPATKAGIASEAVKSNTYLADWAASAVSPRRNSIASLENGAQISDIIGAEVQAAVLGMKTAQQAADDMQSKLEAVM